VVDFLSRALRGQEIALTWNRPLSALISNLESSPWGSRATLMLTDACMTREGCKVRLQGNPAQRLSTRAACQAGRPQGRGFGYAIPFTSQATIYYPESCQQWPIPSNPLRRRENEAMT